MFVVVVVVATTAVVVVAAAAVVVLEKASCIFTRFFSFWSRYSFECTYCLIARDIFKSRTNVFYFDLKYEYGIQNPTILFCL